MRKIVKLKKTASMTNSTRPQISLGVRMNHERFATA